MEDKAASLTDEIYQELMDGLKTGLDWTHFLAKYGGSKGPLYNAFARFSHDMEPKVRELSAVQAKVDAAGLQLDQRGLELNSLDQKVKEADKVIQTKNHDLALLEEKRNVLNEQLETIETKLA